MKHKQGFTLIEVMVTVAIIGILATIAYPSYTDYLIRGRIPEGPGALSNEKVWVEKYFGDNRSLTGACDKFPVSTRYFQVTCELGDDDPPKTYTLTAKGRDSMTDFVYTIDERGNKQTTGLNARWTASLPSDRTLPLNCWVLKKDGSC